MLFISIPELKSRLNTQTLDIVKSPKTSKLFGNTGSANLRVEQSIDLKKPVKFMYESDDTFNDGCIVNVTESNNVVASL